MILFQILFVLILIAIVYCIIFGLGVWLLPYLNIRFCEIFFKILPATSIIILAISTIFYENNIKECMRLKEITEYFDKKEKEKRLERINKQKERSI